MKAKDANILFVAHVGEEDDHWINRWAEKLSTAERISRPKVADGEDPLMKRIAEAEGKAVLVAHGSGVADCVAAIRGMGDKIAGAFFVAPSIETEEEAESFSRDPLACPSIVVASRTAERSSYAIVEDLASAWGSLLIDAGEVGNLDAGSGHGPWPEGSLTFARFVSRLPD